MPDRNDLLEDREGDLCIVREVLDDNKSSSNGTVAPARSPDPSAPTSSPTSPSAYAS
jgi:hypothetical protein